jgi:hypothetical protein
MNFINTQHKIPDDWLNYEYMCIEKHCQDNPDHKMFHWGDLPENI